MTVKAAKRGDDAVDAARKLYNGADKASKFRKSTGTYEIIYESGKNYVGKGGFARSIKSAANHAKPNKLNGYQEDAVLSITWIPAESKEKAFMNEYLMQLSKGKNNSNTYNLIWSPGRSFAK